MIRTLVASAFALVTALALPAPFWGVSGAARAADFAPADFAEPVTLASKDGVLEVTLTAHQGQASLDTVAMPVKNVLVFGYALIRGTRLERADVGRQFCIPRRRCRSFPARR